MERRRAAGGLHAAPPTTGNGSSQPVPSRRPAPESGPSRRAAPEANEGGEEEEEDRASQGKTRSWKTTSRVVRIVPTVPRTWTT